MIVGIRLSSNRKCSDTRVMVIQDQSHNGFHLSNLSCLCNFKSLVNTSKSTIPGFSHGSCIQFRQALVWTDVQIALDESVIFLNRHVRVCWTFQLIFNQPFCNFTTISLYWIISIFQLIPYARQMQFDHENPLLMTVEELPKRSYCWLPLYHWILLNKSCSVAFVFCLNQLNWVGLAVINNRLFAFG